MESGFFESLFDLEFRSLVAPRIAKFVFALSLLGAAGWTLVTIWSATQQTGLGALATVFLAVVGGLTIIMFARIYLEVIVVLFRISESVERSNMHLASLVHAADKSAEEISESELRAALDAAISRKDADTIEYETSEGPDAKSPLGRDAEDVYRFLVSHGHAGFEEIAQQTGMTQKEVSEGVSILQEHDLVERFRGGVYSAKHPPVKK